MIYDRKVSVCQPVLLYKGEKECGCNKKLQEEKRTVKFLFKTTRRESDEKDKFIGCRMEDHESAVGTGAPDDDAAHK